MYMDGTRFKVGPITLKNLSRSVKDQSNGSQCIGKTNISLIDSSAEKIIDYNKKFNLNHYF